MYLYGFSIFLSALAVITSIAGGIVLYVMFVRKPNTYQGKTALFHDAMNFKVLFTDALLRMLYGILAIGIAAGSLVSLLSNNIIGAIVGFVVGEIALRVGFELTMLLIILARNVIEINGKLGGGTSAPMAARPMPQQQPVAQQENTMPQRTEQQ